jgi:hypothetical protein
MGKNPLAEGARAERGAIQTGDGLAHKILPNTVRELQRREAKGFTPMP